MSQSKTLPQCDCINSCGDDDRVGQGAAQPCSAYHKMLASQADHEAVRNLSCAMMSKLQDSRSKGRSGWNDKTQCSAEYLSQLLREHVEKGDPVDVANFCAFLSARGEGITPQAAPAVVAVPDEQERRKLKGLMLEVWACAKPHPDVTNEQLRGILGRCLPYIRALAATPAAAAPVVLPEPQHWVLETQAPDREFDYTGVQKKAEHWKAIGLNPTTLFTEQQLRTALLAAVSAPAAQAEKKLPQSEGADYFVILDQKAGTVEFAYTADLGRAFGHDHIKDAQERDSTTAHRWVVRPAYASPQAHDDKGARMKVAAALDCEGVNFAWSYLTGAIKELVKAERELVQLKPLAQADASDAARYRWLRDISVAPHNFYLSVPEEFAGVKYAKNEVDNYIDAAIAAQRGDAA